MRENNLITNIEELIKKEKENFTDLGYSRYLTQIENLVNDEKSELLSKHLIQGD